MKGFYFIGLCAFILFSSCGQGSDHPTPVKDTVVVKPAEETTVPGAEKLAFSDSIVLQVNENMRFDKELFRVHAGKKIKLIIRNTGKKSTASMTHNVVLLAKGTDIADFAEVARLAKEEHYVPSSVASLIIAHTKMVGGGESDETSFTIPTPGVYDYICSYPGHWGTMQGKIVVE